LGQQCIEYAEPLPKKTPENLYSAYQTSSRKYPDFTNEDLWGALDKGKRPLKQALAILQQAEESLAEGSSVNEAEVRDSLVGSSFEFARSQIV